MDVKAATAVAAEVRRVTGISANFHPLFVVRAAGLLPCHKPGLGRAAVLDSLCQIVIYDEQAPRWREQVTAIACGRLLVLYGARDVARARAVLASLLGAPVDRGSIEDDGAVTAATLKLLRPPRKP
jgi:uncharacterized membrane protein